MWRWSTLIVFATLALAGCTRPNDLYGGTGGGAAGSGGGGGGGSGGGSGVADLAGAAAHDLAADEAHDMASGGGHDLSHPLFDLGLPTSCASACNRCATGPCCGNGCCGVGEWCDKDTCRCGSGPACGVAQSCGGGAGGPGQCGVKCCTGGVICL